MAGRPANLRININTDSSDAVRDVDRLGSSLGDLEDEARRAGRSLDDVGEHGGNVASTASQAAGAFGDLGGALDQMGGPLGKIGGAMEAMGPTIMGLAGAGDLLEVVFAKLRLQNLRATAAMIKQKAVTLATTVASKAQAVAQAALNLVMRANPVMLVVTALGALVAIFVVAYKKSETFRAIVKAAFDVILTAARAVADFFTVQIPAAFGAIITGITTAWTAVSTWVAGLPGTLAGLFAKAATWLYTAGKDILTGLWNGITAVWASVTGWFGKVGGWVVGFFAKAATWLYNAGKTVLGGLWSGIRWYFTNVVETFYVKLPAKLAGYFAKAATWLYGSGKSILQGLWDGITNVWDSAWSWISGVGGKIKDAFTGASTWLFQAGKDLLTGLWNGLKNAISGVGGMVADMAQTIVNAIVDGLNSFLKLPWVIKFKIPMPWPLDDFHFGPWTLMPKIPRWEGSAAEDSLAMYSRANPVKFSQSQDIRVYIGDRELTDLVRAEVRNANRAQATRIAGGIR